MTFDIDKAKVRLARDLREVETLFAELHVEALNHADDNDMPGGESMVLIGPHADPEAWGYRQMSIALGRVAVTGGLELDSDPIPPLQALAGWEDIIRAELGTGTDKRATITDAVAYVRNSITWMFDTNAEGDMNFLAVDDLMNDLSKIVGQMERVLHAGIRDDKGVPCMRCGRALVKVWGTKDQDASHDRWHCKVCDEWSSVDQYNLAVKAAHRANADRLNATDMLAEYRIKPGSLTGWASKKLVAKRGKDSSGRILYDVEQAVTQRDKADRPADDEPRDAA